MSQSTREALFVITAIVSVPTKDVPVRVLNNCKCVHVILAVPVEVREAAAVSCGIRQKKVEYDGRGRERFHQRVGSGAKVSAF
jgi:hypothetical protein